MKNETKNDITDMILRWTLQKWDMYGIRKFKYETKKNHRGTLKGHATELSRLIGKQTAIISEATLSKKAEVYLEASPQAILQLYIIAISYKFSINQVATIVSSLLVTTIGTMTTYLKEPTKVIYSK